MLGDTYIDYCYDCKRYHEYTLDWDESSNLQVLVDSDGDVTMYDLTDADVAEMMEGQDAAWASYFATVAETGDDYLHQILVNRAVKENWYLAYRDAGDGVVFEWACKEGDPTSMLFFGNPDLPKDVLNFATGYATDTEYVTGIANLDELYESAAYDSATIKRLSKSLYLCTINVARSQEDIKAEIRKIAAAHGKEA